MLYLTRTKYHLSKKKKTFSNIIIINNKVKNYTRYLDTAIIIHIIYYFSCYITYKFNHGMAKIEITDDNNCQT